MTADEPADPRQADVAAAEALLVAAARDGAALLPDLIGVDLCALGAAFQAVFDEPVWRAWVNLPDAYREQLTGDAFRGLAGRRLMDPPQSVPEAGGRPLARIAPALGLIMMARNQPAFLVQCAVDGEQRGAPRMYGIAQEDMGVRAVLVERASNERIGFGVQQHVVLSRAEDLARRDDLHQLYKYVLLSPGRSISTLASWLCDDRSAATRTLDLYRNSEGEGLTRIRLTANRESDGRLVVTDDDGPIRGENAGTADDVANELTRRVLVGTAAR